MASLTTLMALKVANVCFNSIYTKPLGLARVKVLLNLEVLYSDGIRYCQYDALYISQQATENTIVIYITIL